MGKHDISMPPGPLLFALINIHSIETTGAVQGIVHPLIVPPFVGVIKFSGIRMIGSAEEIDFSQIIGITKMINNASVKSGPAVGDIGVAVNIPPVQPIGFSLHRPLVAVIGRPFWSFMGMRKFLDGSGFDKFLRIGFGKRTAGGEGGKVDGGSLVFLVRSLIGRPADSYSLL